MEVLNKVKRDLFDIVRIDDIELRYSEYPDENDLNVGILSHSLVEDAETMLILEALFVEGIVGG